MTIKRELQEPGTGHAQWLLNSYSGQVKILKARHCEQLYKLRSNPQREGIVDLQKL